MENNTNNTDNTNKTNKTFSRDDFLSMPEARVHEHFCKALGATVNLKELSALEYEEYSRSLLEFKTDEKGNTSFEHRPEGMRLKFLVRSLCDEKGKRLFQDEEYTLLGSKLTGKATDAVRELYEKAIEINGGGDEELEKNLKTDQKGGSSSD